MKKVLKLILINAGILFICFAILEFCLYHNFHSHHPEFKYTIKRFNYDNILKLYPLRPFEGLEYNARPIIITGCSYAYGQGLEREQTFGYKLSKLTKRPVYNYSLYGKGLQNTLYMLQNDMFDKSIKDPEYVIYVFMSDQIRRLYTTVCLNDYSGYPVYKVKKDGSVELKSKYYPVYMQFYTYYLLKNIYFMYFDQDNLKKHSRLINAYFLAIHKEIKKKYPNAKFVILMYNDIGNHFGLRMKPLKEDGIDIIFTSQLTRINLCGQGFHLAEDDYHPSEEAWDIVTPALAKRLNLIE